MAVVLIYGTTVNANNIQIANATLTGNTGTTALVQFDLSWENSWRGGGVNNWDAAWVFVKYRTNAAGAWSHVNLNNTGHVPATGSQVDLGLLDPAVAYDANTNPVVGVFISRNVDGTGNMALPNTQLSWNYGALGLAFNDIFEVEVFAIEMVYVNQGAFAAGSGGFENFAFTLTTIITADATSAPSGTGSLGGQAGGYPTGETAPSSASWPNGYGAFYCMKYEITQQGYVDFLNTLTYTQQDARTATASNSAAGTGALQGSNADRNGIDVQTPRIGVTPAVYACNLNGNGVFGEADDGADIACNFLSWGDVSAYLDWSGLRPMTELEFEKACRGTLAPVPNEYAWGPQLAATEPYTLSNAGATNEGIATNYSTTRGNVISASTVPQGGSISGPVRVGICSANGSNTGRVSAGASYYGIMELSGNVFEQAVTINDVEGRAFTGTHGNGTLASDGDHYVLSWPSGSTAVGAMRKGGGALAASSAYLEVSDRLDQNGQIGRVRFNGGRGVRSAP